MTSTPFMGFPTVPMHQSSGRFHVAGPLVSVMPYISMISMPRLMKNSCVLRASGAAPVTMKRQRSSPSAPFTRWKMSSCANQYLGGMGCLRCFAYAPSRPFCLAHATTFFHWRRPNWPVGMHHRQ